MIEILEFLIIFLKYLDIDSIIFNNKIYIRLPNLKSLYCVKCAKLYLSDIFCPKLVKLRYADYGNYKIPDINALKSDNFKELKELNLRSNNISDINVLEKVKFKKLEGLRFTL